MKDNKTKTKTANVGCGFMIVVWAIFLVLKSLGYLDFSGGLIIICVISIAIIANWVVTNLSKFKFKKRKK